MHLVCLSAPRSFEKGKTTERIRDGNNHAGILRVPGQMWFVMVLRLGLHSHGLHSSRDIGHISILRLHCNWPPKNRYPQERRVHEVRTYAHGHRPLHSSLHHPSILLLHGFAQGTYDFYIVIQCPKGQK